MLRKKIAKEYIIVHHLHIILNHKKGLCGSYVHVHICYKYKNTVGKDIHELQKSWTSRDATREGDYEAPAFL